MPTRARRVGLTKQEQRDASIERLLGAAEKLFVTKGFHATTTDEIGASAGLTKGSVYFYFGDKTSVLLALLEKVEATVLQPLIDKVENGGGTPLERIEAFLLHQADVARESPAMLLLPIIVSIEFAGTGELAEKRVKWGYQRTGQALRKAVAQGQELGLFRSDVSAEQQASMMLALSDGAMLEWLRSEHDSATKELVETLRSVLLAGISSMHAKGLRASVGKKVAAVHEPSRGQAPRRQPSERRVPVAKKAARSAKKQ